MISGYIGNTLIYMAVTAAVYLPCRILFVKRKGQRAPLWREACLMLFWMLVVGIVSQTVFPRILIGVTDGGEWYFSANVFPRTAPNFIPLRTIWLFWEHRTDSSAWASISLLNLAGNVLLFVPVGVLFPLAYPKSDRFKSIFLWSLGGIVCIGTLQYFFGRVADVDDVILNVAGILLGFGVYRLCRKLAARISARVGRHQNGGEPL